jgi:hypothetical protein
MIDDSEEVLSKAQKVIVERLWRLFGTSRKLIITPGGVGDVRGMSELNNSVTLVKSRNLQNDNANQQCEDGSVPAIVLPMCRVEHVCHFLDICFYVEHYP